MQRTHTDQQPIWQTTLGEGCQLTVLQTAQAQQAAVALSFAAGSHHEPAQYLGMAHFLEHLVFRGSEKYAADDGLMAFIQRHAGQVNAQTQGQQTLFHFQVDAPLLQDALARLVDMLTAPLLSSELLRTEREVINEEFALYCRTPQVLMDAALAPCLLAEHPLQRFYAGNRYTLDIESKDFAQALHGFHQRAYLRSALKIVLVLPQPWELWQAELLHTLGPLACTPRNLSVPSLPKLQVERTAAVRLSLPMNERHWVLHVPINQAGLGLAELAEKTQHALALSTGQTFLNIARQHGWCTDISVRASFSAQEQGVLSIYFRGGSGEQAVLFEAFIQWMQQWQQVLQSPPQQAYERQAQANRWLLASPLQQAQQVLVHGWPLQQGISAKCLAALDAVLGALTIGAVVQVQAGPEAVSGHYDYGLPLQVQRAEALSANVAKSAIEFDFTREVNTAIERYSAAKEETVILSGQLLARHQAALCHYQPPCLPDTVAVCYWGWAVANAQVLAQCLAQHLAAVSEVLSYNAVDWQAECTQTMLFIRLSGPANYLPVAANRLLTALEASFVVQPQQPRAQPVVQVFLTHHHPDHALGNQAFADVPIAALQATHELLAEQGDHMAENMYRVVGDWMRGTEVQLPTHTVEPGVVNIGGHSLQLLAFTGHTGADLVLLDLRTGVLFAGDMLFYQRALATPNSPSLKTWLADLDRLQALPWQVVVPGHGPLAKDKQPFVQMRDYLTWLDNALRQAAEQGMDMNQVLRLPIPEQFATISLTRHELIRTVSHLYPQYEQQQWQRIDQ